MDKKKIAEMARQLRQVVAQFSESYGMPGTEAICLAQEASRYAFLSEKEFARCMAILEGEPKS